MECRSSVTSGAHTHYIHLSGIHAPALRVWAPPLTEHWLEHLYSDKQQYNKQLTVLKYIENHSTPIVLSAVCCIVAYQSTSVQCGCLAIEVHKSEATAMGITNVWLGRASGGTEVITTDRGGSLPACWGPGRQRYYTYYLLSWWIVNQDILLISVTWPFPCFMSLQATHIKSL